MKVYKFRDLTLIDINKDQTMVIACDSAGGIGDKELDLVKTSQEVIGYFTTNVALMEVLSYGAKPITVVNNLSVEMKPSGEGIIRGIKKALEPLNIDCENIITGSTEENIPVKTTGIGVTIIGMIDRNKWEKPKSEPGNIVVCVGIPKVGDEVIEDKEKTIMNIDRLLKLLKLDYINEILPVGSKGIRHELGELAETNNLSYEFCKDINLDIDKTAGPSTCVLLSISPSDYDSLKLEIDIELNKIARLKRRII